VISSANRLTSVGGVPYTWDDNGNLLGDGVFTYTYNTAGRMVGAQSTTTLAYTYNADGLRVAQSMGGVETAFTWDLAAGLAQVLATSDGVVYLHGLHLIAEQRSGVWWYPLGDALGSVRQWTDDSGSVSYAGGYTPFGVELWREGSAASHWGYTGEWWDADAALLYLRARWYAPRVGRFTSRDVWEGDWLRPQSLHAYVYVENNAVNLTDPTGMMPVPPLPGRDARDLTDWLVREMQANANGPEVAEILNLNRLAEAISEAGWLGEGARALELDLRGIAAYEWRELVKDGARWDFKDRIDRVMGKTIVLCHSSGGCEWFEYSVPGNIHYGYVGRAAGFSSSVLHFGASVAEVMDPAHEEEIKALGKYFVNVHLALPCLPIKMHLYVNFQWWSAGFDDPTDFAAVDLGIALYERARTNVTLVDFQYLLPEYSSRLMHMPAPSEPYFNPYWPYPLGYFDGGGQ